MKVVFDRSIPIVGLGLVPWTRLGPERWLDRYVIASLYDGDVKDVAGVPQVLSLAEANPRALPSALTTQALLEVPEFKTILTSLSGYDCLPYKPVNVPKDLPGMRLLGSDRQLSRDIENKAKFRARFKEEVRFPHYRIVRWDDIASGSETLQTLLGGRQAIIIQDERLSGGRGTFKVHDEASLQVALARVQELGVGTHAVVSELIEDAHERSVQCCVTRYGVFVGPLQKQIVGDPLLANMESAEGDKFCGGEIGAKDRFEGAYPNIRSYALAIGKRLATLGYKGIFGVDCLVDERGEAYVLEVNPRLTGMTPLITMLYRDERDIPFYLLHILELGNYEYRLEDTEVDAPQCGSMMLVHALEPSAVRVEKSPRSGLYNPNDLSYKEAAIEFKGSEPQLLLQRYTPLHATMKTGGRVVTAFLNAPCLDNDDKVSPAAEQMIAALKTRVNLKEVSIWAS